MKNIPLERIVVAKIIRALKAHGVSWCIKTHGGTFQGAGLPDILAIAPQTGRLLGIEVKRPHIGKLTALQQNQLDKIMSAGGVAGVATCADEALALLAKANSAMMKTEG